jgi:hypothetical protein
MERQAIEAKARAARVTVHQIRGTAQDGWWMAVGPLGVYLAARRTRLEALQVGVQLAEAHRFAVCARF